MSKTSDARQMNARGASLGHGSIGEISIAKSNIGQMEFKNGVWHTFRPPTPDANLQKFRYDSTYIPGSDKNVVSPMLSMKYNLSKENIKL